MAYSLADRTIAIRAHWSLNRPTLEPSLFGVRPMATQKITIVRDDLTGAEIDPDDAVTVPLVLGVQAWELDLSRQIWLTRSATCSAA